MCHPIAKAKFQVNMVKRGGLPSSTQPPVMKQSGLNITENTGAPVNLPLVHKVMVPCWKRQAKAGCYNTHHLQVLSS